MNLERALPVNGRNSGHFVQGHVDDMGTILSMEPDQDSLVVKVTSTPKADYSRCKVENMKCCVTPKLTGIPLSREFRIYWWASTNHRGRLFLLLMGA